MRLYRVLKPLFSMDTGKHTEVGTIRLESEIKDIERLKAVGAIATVSAPPVSEVPELEPFLDYFEDIQVSAVNNLFDKQLDNLPDIDAIRAIAIEALTVPDDGCKSC